MSKTRRRAPSKNRRYETHRAQMVKRARSLRKMTTDCRKCGKRGYPSEFAAQDAVITGAGRAGVRVYQCESGLWHTTNRDTVWPGWRRG